MDGARAGRILDGRHASDLGNGRHDGGRASHLGDLRNVARMLWNHELGRIDACGLGSDRLEDLRDLSGNLASMLIDDDRDPLLF